jgi:putative hydrolase of the HAD superfamily
VVLESGAGFHPAIPTWILFDAVGTLIYPNPPVAEVYQDAGRRFGSRLTADEISGRFRAALVESFSVCEPTTEPQERVRWQQIVNLVFDDVPHAGGDLFQVLWRHFAQPEHWRLFDDVPATLHELASRGYHLGIVSNFDGRLRQIIEGHSPLAACQVILLSSELGYIKPDRRFFEAAGKQLAVNPAEILLVGDDEAADLGGALAAGWQAMLISRNSQRKNLAALSDLSQLLERLA